MLFKQRKGKRIMTKQNIEIQVHNRLYKQQKNALNMMANMTFRENYDHFCAYNWHVITKK